MTRLPRLLPLLLSLALLSALGGQRGTPATVHRDNVPPAPPLTPGSVTALPSAQRAAAPTGTGAVLTLDYDLGAESCGDMPYRLRGRLSLPQSGERLPLVLLLHGSYDSRDPDGGYYLGFSYLTEALARRGFAAASLDIQPAYVWEYGKQDDDQKAAAITRRQLEYFSRANRGEALFPQDLTGRLDLDRLILVGHSRGGDTALDLANELDGAIGAAAVAPGLRTAEKAWRDIPLAILVPELDGDVTDLDGYAYLGSLYAAGRERPAAATLLRGANHNFFLTGLTRNDAEGAPGLLTPEAQRDFLSRYLSDFCAFAAYGQAEGTIFDLTRPAPATLYGQAADTLLVSPALTLLSDLSQGAPALNCTAQRLTVDTHTTDLRIPLAWGTDQSLTLWQFQGQGSPAVAQLPLTVDSLSGFDGLALDLAPAPDVRQPQSLLLVLEDRDGASAAVRLPPLTPAAETAVYTTFTQVRVPLALFPGVDTGRLARIALLPDQSSLWGVLVSAVYGYTAP